MVLTKEKQTGQWNRIESAETVTPIQLPDL